MVLSDQESLWAMQRQQAGLQNQVMRVRLLPSMQIRNINVEASQK